MIFVSLQKKTANKFVVMRYLHPECVGNVYYGFYRKTENEQPIENFHLLIAGRLLTWIDDPIVSPRTRATNSEINRMLVNALNFPDSLRQIELLRRRKQQFQVCQTSSTKLYTLCKTKTDQFEAFLLRMLTLNMALLPKKIVELRAQNPDALAYADVFSNYDNSMVAACVDDLERVQQQQVETMQRTKEKALHIDIANHFIKWAELRNILSELLATCDKYTVDMNEDRKVYWRNEENNQLVAMRANLNDYFNGRESVSADDIVMCQKLIDNAERDLDMLQQKSQENGRKIEDEMRQIQSNINQAVDAMNGMVNGLNNWTKRLLTTKRSR